MDNFKQFLLDRLVRYKKAITEDDAMFSVMVLIAVAGFCLFIAESIVVFGG